MRDAREVDHQGALVLVGRSTRPTICRKVPPSRSRARGDRPRARRIPPFGQHEHVGRGPARVLGEARRARAVPLRGVRRAVDVSRLDPAHGEVRREELDSPRCGRTRPSASPRAAPTPRTRRSRGRSVAAPVRGHRTPRGSRPPGARAPWRRRRACRTRPEALRRRRVSGVAVSPRCHASDTARDKRRDTSCRRVMRPSTRRV